MTIPNMAGTTLRLGLRSDYRGTYDNTYIRQATQYGNFMQYGAGTDTYLTPFAYPESQTYPSQHGWGMPIKEKPTRYVDYDSVQKRWADSVSTLNRDSKLSTLGGINEDAQSRGRNFGTLAARAMTQMMEGTVDPALLETLPLAPDGSPIYSATSGTGADRFGILGGNLLTGLALGTGAGLRDAVMSLIEQILQFKDTESQPLQNQDLFSEFGMDVMLPTGLFRQGIEAFKQTMTPLVGTTDAATSGGNVTTANYLTEAGFNIPLLLTPHLTVETAIYIAVKGAPVKPMTELVSQDFTESYYDASNSEHRGETGTSRWLFEKWCDYFTNLPLRTAKGTT